MKDLLTEERYEPEEIAAIIKADDERYQGKVESTLCRLYCYGERNNHKSALYLLPWCFDKLKKFKKERQVMGYWVKRLNDISNSQMSVSSAFEKWKWEKKERQMFLKGKKFK